MKRATHGHVGLLGLLLALASLGGGACGRLAAETVREAEERTLPVLMYHSILKDPARAGRYVVSPAVFRADMEALIDRGYESVTAAELVAFADGTGELPEKPVLITLDDGYLNNLTYVLPILEELDMHAAISIVGAYAERFTETPDPNPNYAHMSWPELSALTASGHVELCNHTFDMHAEYPRAGAARCRGESTEDYRRAFTADVTRLQNAFSDRLSIRPVLFAYPFGKISPESADCLSKMGFRCVLTCYERVNVITSGQQDTLMALGRFNRPAGLSTEAFLARVLN